MKNKIFYLTACVLIITAIACKKKKDAHVPPDVVFTTGVGYTSADATVAKGDTIKVGVTATKTEDDLKSYNASYAYDGATTTTTFFNYYLQPSEYLSYSKTLSIPVRNQAGSEKWTFSIVDRDGNITQKTITLTVQ
jgi:hypothetical protein